MKRRRREFLRRLRVALRVMRGQRVFYRTPQPSRMTITWPFDTKDFYA